MVIFQDFDPFSSSFFLSSFLFIPSHLPVFSSVFPSKFVHTLFSLPLSPSYFVLALCVRGTAINFDHLTIYCGHNRFLTFSLFSLSPPLDWNSYSILILFPNPETLRALYLGDNDFEHFSPEVGQLKNLQVVSLFSRHLNHSHHYLMHWIFTLNPINSTRLKCSLCEY